MKTANTMALTAMLLALPLAGSAQRLVASGHSAEALVPEGWTVEQTQGDLDHDGIDDLVMILTPNDEDGIEKREDGYVYNFNSPILGIYTGQRGGGFTLMREYGDILEPNSHTMTVERQLEITDKGVLKVTVSNFYTMGSWNSPTSTYVVRLQQGDFYLIGMETDNHARNTGEGEKDSYNYLTHKKQHITYNVFDEKVKPRETWSRLPKSPLKRLGAFDLSAE